MTILLIILGWWALGAGLTFLMFSQFSWVTQRMVIVMLLCCVPCGVLLPIGMALLWEVDDSLLD